MNGTIVIQMQKRLTAAPSLPHIENAVIRTFQGQADVDAWLSLRDRAFARERVGVRSWSADDFQREFLDKSWWDPAHLWLAEGTGEDAGRLLGTVTLARRGGPAEGLPVIHWLMVAPSHRRRGIARALLAHLERAVSEQADREILLETHVHWERATAFYEACGYRVVP